MWYVGLPALGFPGAGATGKLALGQLEGIKKIFAIRGPGEGGETFIRGIARRLPVIGFAGEAFENSIGGFKDPSESYCDSPSDFFDRFEDVLNRAQILIWDSVPQAQRCVGFQSLDEY